MSQIEQKLDSGTEMMDREPQTKIDRCCQIEPLRRIIVERAIELFDAARELRGLEIGSSKILPQRLQRTPRIRRWSGRGRDVALQMIDDKPEAVTQPSHRIAELQRDLDRDLPPDLV